jgi:hypothetical protein
MKESGQSNIGTFCYQIGSSGASPLSQVSANCGLNAAVIRHFFVVDFWGKVVIPPQNGAKQKMSL